VGDKIQKAQEALTNHQNELVGIEDEISKLLQQTADSWRDVEATLELSHRYSALKARLAAGSLVTAGLEKALNGAKIEEKQDRLIQLAKDRQAADRDYNELEKTIVALDSERGALIKKAKEAAALRERKGQAAEVEAQLLIQLGSNGENLKKLVSPYGCLLYFPYIHTGLAD
jgi:uncharacterized coiled-coil DUF342 family protein